MMSPKQRQEQERKIAIVKEYAETHDDAKPVEIARATGIDHNSVLRYLRRISAAEKVNSRVLLSEAKRTPPSLESVLKAYKVDLARWEVERHVINVYEQGSKREDGKGVNVVPLYQLKAWLRKIKGADEKDLILETLDYIRNNCPIGPATIFREARLVKDKILHEYGVPDLHLGKLAWGEESGDNYDTAIAESLFMEAIAQLAERASVFPPDEILFVVGNDFFNVNSGANATHAGTPQSEDDRWPKTFRKGIALIQRGIEYLRTKAPIVRVRFIRGNHDSERIFMAGEVISALYEHVPGVEVVNHPKKRQYLSFGIVLLGLMHGDGVKPDKLPLIMAGEAPDLWAKTKHREIHLGHFHHKRETQYHAGTEVNAVRVRILPALTAADEWHYNAGYVGQQRAAELYIWGERSGYVGHLSFTV